MKVEIEMEQHMSSGSKKSSTEYYELKLQLRFTYYNDIDTIKKEVFSIIDNNFTGVNKFDELEKGFDIYFRDHGIKNKVCKIFNKKFFCDEKHSKKIVGHNFLESKSVWRYTVMLNIINLNKNDIISIKGEEFYIKAFNGKDLVLRNLETGAKKVASYNIIKDYFKLVEKK